MANSDITKAWLSTTEAATFLRTSKSFLDKDRINGLVGIPFTKLGGKVLYNIGELNAFLESKTVRRVG